MIAATLPNEWVACDVVLEDVGANRRAVRRFLVGAIVLFLGETRRLMKRAPSVVMGNQRPAVASAVVAHLESLGARARVTQAGGEPDLPGSKYAAWKKTRVKTVQRSRGRAVVFRPVGGWFPAIWGVLAAAFGYWILYNISAWIFWTFFAGGIVVAVSSVLMTAWALRKDEWPEGKGLWWLYHLGGSERAERDGDMLVARRRLFWSVRSWEKPIAEVAAVVVDPEFEREWL
ncbi:MAG: hypothetical protein MI861_03615, partial [Pirellulales bacterium]|nr:hypothetical protein [Pirellulales bacterium]